MIKGKTYLCEVDAQVWDEKLVARFGKRNSRHNLSGDDVFWDVFNNGRAIISRIGRVGKPERDLWRIKFENKYD